MEQKPRRFGLADMLILIAALGAGIYGARELWRMQVEKPGSYWTPVTPSWLMEAAMAASVATPLTLACMAFRLRSPRPPRHRLWLQPGTAAMLACSMLFVVKFVEADGSFRTATPGRCSGTSWRASTSTPSTTSPSRPTRPGTRSTSRPGASTG
jgi:peptidoglycan/LPS O-acetylase OafA/YrhL